MTLDTVDFEYPANLAISSIFIELTSFFTSIIDDKRFFYSCQVFYHHAETWKPVITSSTVDFVVTPFSLLSVLSPI